MPTGIGIGLSPSFGGGAPAVTPATVGVDLWLGGGDLSKLFQDAARTTPCAADSDPVGGLIDKSGNLVTGAQATATKRPLVRTGANGVNGSPAVQFDGADDYIDLGNVLNYTGSLSLFAVFKPSDVASNNWQILSRSDGTANAQLELRITASKLSFVAKIGAGLQVLSAATTLVVNTLYSYVFTLNPTTGAYQFFKSGAADGAGTSPTTGALNSQAVNCLWGIRNPASPSLPWHGLVPDLAAAGRVFGAPEVAQLAAYSLAKWGV